MRSLLVFLSLTSLVVASLNTIIPTLNELGLNGSEVEKYFFRQPNNAPYGTCNSQKFLYAQTVFNEMLNISSAYTWRNASQIAYAVKKIIEIKGVDGVVRVCNAHQAFVSTLSGSYPICLNRYYLLNQRDSNFPNAVEYVHLYKHLDFICSTGFDVFQSKLTCILRAANIEGTQLQACQYKFSKVISDNPNQFCRASEDLITCYGDAFTEACGKEVGWVQCEKERIGFAYDCNGLVC